jgi:HSP20 family protein
MKTTKELMTLEPWTFMRRVFPDFEGFFNEARFPTFWTGGKTGEFPWVPDLEVFERDNHMMVRLDLPGLKREEVTVTATEEGLTIEGERKHEKEEKNEKWYTKERTYGRFYRYVPMPEGFNAGAVKATFTDGVLEITVPVPVTAAAAPPRKVPIEAGAEKAAKVAA